MTNILAPIEVPIFVFSSSHDKRYRLVTITNNHISFECKCGHTSLIPVTAFIEKFGREAELNEVVTKARCSNCLIKNNAESRIVFIGGSGQAMLGTAVQPKKGAV